MSEYRIKKANVGYVVLREQSDRYGHEFWAFSTMKELTNYLPSLIDPKPIKPEVLKRRKTDKK